MEKWVLALIPLYFLYIVFLGLLMFGRRFSALKRGEVKLSHFRAYSSSEPDSLRVMSNHFSNQFQVPIVFFIACVVSVQLNRAGSITFVLGILFILTRLAHSYIHLGSNNVRARAVAYFLGLLILLVMWAYILLG